MILLCVGVVTVNLQLLLSYFYGTLMLASYGMSAGLNANRTLMSKLDP